MQAGGSINDFQMRTYARIQLSKAAEYYPGTAERTLLVTGRLKEMIAALKLIFDKLLREGVAPLSPRTRASLEALDQEKSDIQSSTRLLVKLLVPQPLCGIIIGKGGSTVRSFSTDTQTTIRVTSPEGPALALNHRIVTINGAVDNVLRAIALITLKQSEDLKYSMFSELPSNYFSHSAGTPGMTALPAGPYGMQQHNGVQSMAVMHPMHHFPQYGSAPPPYATASPDGITTVSYPITEEQVAVLQGQAGSGLDEIQTAAGVHIGFDVHESGGGPDGGGRALRLVVVGHADAVGYAHNLMGQRMMMQQQYSGMYSQYHGLSYYQPMAHTYRSHMYGGGMGGPYAIAVAETGGRRPENPKTLTPRQYGEGT